MAKISKLMIWPSRKVNLGNYNTADLNAGVEVVFDNAVEMDSQEIKDAFTKARKIIHDEMKEQYKPYMVKKSK